MAYPHQQPGLTPSYTSQQYAPTVNFPQQKPGPAVVYNTQSQPGPTGSIQQQPGLAPGYTPQQYVPTVNYTQQKPGPTVVYTQPQPGQVGFTQQEPGPAPGYTPQLPGPVYPAYPPQLPGPVHPAYPQQISGTFYPAYNIQQQPPPNPGMSLAGGNRNVKNLPVGPDGQREWSHGLCGCQVGTCLLAWCLPCILYGQVKQRFEHLHQRGFPDPQRGGLCNNDTVGYFLISYFTGCSWILQMGSRQLVRERYNIRGGGCSDCSTAFWCIPCDLTQVSRELELEERSFANQGNQGNPGPIAKVG